MRVIVTASRTWDDGTFIWNELHKLWVSLPPRERILVVAHGDCPEGGDRHADAWAEGMRAKGERVRALRYPADWDHCLWTCSRGHRVRKRPGDTVHPGFLDDYCPGAGPRRNAGMVAFGADRCLAFLRGNSRGAGDCAIRAEEVGISTHIYQWDLR